MGTRSNIFVIIGSASKHSANEKLVDILSSFTSGFFNFTIMNELKHIPHFDPELSTTRPPEAVLNLRDEIKRADGVIICTPEYIFSIPSGLKNAIEWCVSTTVFCEKPVGLITASASGLKAHDELKLIMRTLMAKFSDDATLLIQGVKGKINEDGVLTDAATESNLAKFIDAFKKQVLV